MVAAPFGLTVPFSVGARLAESGHRGGAGDGATAWVVALRRVRPADCAAGLDRADAVPVGAVRGRAPVSERLVPVTAGRVDAPVTEVVGRRAGRRSRSRLVELSVQLRLICELDVAVAVSPVGASTGSVLKVPVAVVVGPGRVGGDEAVLVGRARASPVTGALAAVGAAAARVGVGRRRARLKLAAPCTPYSNSVDGGRAVRVDGAVQRARRSADVADRGRSTTVGLTGCRGPAGGVRHRRV